MIKKRVIIAGSGFSGIALSHYLKTSGIEDFTILEKAGGLGGTWRENTYPGAECDIGSALYSFSFAPNPTWDFKWARGQQILSYIQKTADDFGITPHIAFNQAVKSAVYNDDSRRWAVTTTDGNIYDAQFFISAVGQLHHPNIPNFPGRDSFEGVSFHAAQWDAGADLTGKRIAVIGSAASAVQLIPEVAKIAGHLDVYQRSPNWMIPKIDAPEGPIEKTLAKYLPWWSKVRRLSLWCQGEYIVWPTIKGARVRGAILKTLANWNMRRAVKDKALRKTLTPDYPIGAKRILFSDHYYPAIMRENVSLITCAADEILSGGVKGKDGVTRDCDVIIYATGFHTNPFLMQIDVTGTGGKPLTDHWREGAQAYLGMTVPGFPNMAMLYGPNTNTGHTSVIYFAECQAKYIAQWVKAAGEGALDVKPDVEAAFNIEVQSRLKKLPWDAIDASWYKDGDKITNNWCGGSREYRKRTKILTVSDFEQV